MTFSLDELRQRGLERYVQHNFRCFCEARLVIRALITANGTVQYKLYCTDCGRLRSGAIAHGRLDARTREQADRAATSHDWPLPPCEHCDDETSGVELHHWAPRAVFGDESWEWPTSYLCKRCHGRWHAMMDAGG